MSDVGDAINEARTEIASSASEFMPDLCDIIGEGLVSDAHSGQTIGETVVASSIPCQVNETPQSAGPIVAGGVSYSGTHRIRLPANANTMAIVPTQMLRVQANDNHGELIFEQPVRAEGSMAVFVTVSAKLTTGFREPANV
jgi:hypothetical protein